MKCFSFKLVGCILISEHHRMVMYPVFTLLSTIAFKLVYVYHYMKKYA